MSYSNFNLFNGYDLVYDNFEFLFHNYDVVCNDIDFLQLIIIA